MTGQLIDRNEAFNIFFGLGTGRTLRILREKILLDHPANVPSYEALKDWSKKYSWQSRVLLMDQAVADGVLETMVPEWIKIKAELLDILLDQIRAGREKGIEPENVRDMALLIKELRAMLGDEGIKRLDLKAELIPPQQIEFVMYDADGVRRDAATGEPKPSEEPADHQIMLPDNHRESRKN